MIIQRASLSASESLLMKKSLSTLRKNQNLRHHSYSRFVSVFAATTSSEKSKQSKNDVNPLAFLLLAAAAASPFHSTALRCDAKNKESSVHWTPAQVAEEDLDQVVKSNNDEFENYPIYTSEQVAENDGSDGKPIWMSYGGVVYDVTDFISNHPGGSEKIKMAAGSVSFIKIYQMH